MSDWKDFFKKAVREAETQFDEVLLDFKAAHRLNKPLQIVPFNTYGTAGHVFFQGRLLEDKKIDRAEDSDSVWKNMLNMYKRLESDEVPGAKIQITLNGKSIETLTDEEGYFFAEMETAGLKTLPEVQTASLKLLEAPFKFEGEVTAEAKVFVPATATDFGVISDVDDTILETGALNLLDMVHNTFMKNASSRLPFAGVDTFYRALQKGPEGKRSNPLFYVSSSPWNLFDFLCDFLEINNIPEGPIMLRDYGIDKDKFITGTHGTHKIGAITKILTTYPNLPFILIGDSGQEDAAIYKKVIEDFPGRILAVYIRDVNDEDRREVVGNIFEEAEKLKVPMLLIPDSEEAAEHAFRSGFISQAGLDSVKASMEEND